VRVLAVGSEATGVIAIGQRATGVIAIGQLSTGVIAIGQLSRGVVAIGQLSVGVVAFGQLGLGMVWAGGLVAIAPLDGPRLVGMRLLGRWPFRALRRGRLSGIEWRPSSECRKPWRVVLALACVVLTILIAISPLVRELTRVGGIVRESPTLR
jgi:hypothetical protein